MYANEQHSNAQDVTQPLLHCLTDVVTKIKQLGQKAQQTWPVNKKAKVCILFVLWV